MSDAGLTLPERLAMAQRLAPDYLPPCPACSLRTPGFQSAPQIVRARHSSGWMLAPCCHFSAADSPIVASVPEADARRALANWWKMRRATGNPEKLAALRVALGLTEEMEATR